MTEKQNDGLKVAYRGAPTEEQIKAILQKRRIARIINTIVFLVLLTAAAYFSYKRYKSLQNTQSDMPTKNEIEATQPAE